MDFPIDRNLYSKSLIKQTRKKQQKMTTYLLDDLIKLAADRSLVNWAQNSRENIGCHVFETEIFLLITVLELMKNVEIASTCHKLLQVLAILVLVFSQDSRA